MNIRRNRIGADLSTRFQVKENVLVSYLYIFEHLQDFSFSKKLISAVHLNVSFDGVLFYFPNSNLPSRLPLSNRNRRWTYRSSDRYNAICTLIFSSSLNILFSFPHCFSCCTRLDSFEVQQCERRFDRSVSWRKWWVVGQELNLSRKTPRGQW